MQTLTLLTPMVETPIKSSTSASNPYQVLIIDRQKAIPANLQENLLSKNFRVQLANSCEEASELLKGDDRYKIIVADCGNTEEGSVECVRELLRYESFFNFPVVVLGYQVDAFGTVLNRYFSIAAGVSYPCQARDVLNAVLSVMARYDKESKVKAPAIEIDTTEDSSGVLDLAGEVASDQLNQSGEGLPERVFAEMWRLNLFNFSLEGAHYLTEINAADLKTRGLLPTDPELFSRVKKVCADAGKWGKPHLFRTAFLSCKFAEALSLSAEQQKTLKSANFLFCGSFCESKRELLRKLYHTTQDLIVRKDLCSNIKDSAMKVALELGDADLSGLVSTIAKIIGREIRAENEPLGLAAACFVAAELIDRVCFDGGTWNSRAAYKLIRRIKSGRLNELPASVLACSIKLLSEAITHAPSATLLPKGALTHPRLSRMAQATKDQEIHSFEEKVAISDIKPGMRLTRPLFSFDGKQILDANVLLDQDLVWRIWQLSAIRPLNGPAVVRRSQNLSGLEDY